ncbi:MAG: urocanate hydratase [Ferruginibacter sp.]
MHQTIYDPVKYATPIGSKLTCKGWIQEGALRMLLNNLNPEVAKHAGELIKYVGSCEAAGNFEDLDCIITTLKMMENDETFVIQNGKPACIMKTHKDAPRLLISNSQHVPGCVNWDHFDELGKKGLMMADQMTPADPIDLISQATVQGTYETYATIASRYFKGTLKGTLNVSAGLGSLGGAQPLSITMNEGVALIAEVDEGLINKRIDSRYLDLKITDIDKAIDQALEATAAGKAISIGVLCNAVHLLEHMVARNVVPDTLTDQTSAHDPLTGYWPHEMSYEFAKVLRIENPKQYTLYADTSIYRHVELMLDLQSKGSISFDYGNNIRSRANERGLKDAFNVFVPDYIRSLFSQNKGPFRWLALSGDPNDITATDELIIKMFPENKSMLRWMKMAKEKITFQGLPSRICWLGHDEREEAGLAFNELVRTGKVKAPIAISRDHLDNGPAACSSNHETDWPILNALVNTAGGASWVSLHHHGTVSAGNSTHAGMVIVADGTDDAALRLRRILRNDPYMGVMPPVDTGYKIAQRTARENNLDLNLIFNTVASTVEV